MNEPRMQERATVRWMIPILLAMPYVVVLSLAAIKFGPLLYELVQVAVKLVVSP